jgi:DNA-directed RNA polymerase specialized sigma24 family protein
VTARLPETRDTLVAALASEQAADRERALDLVARAYREPVVSILALRWTLAREDAEDLTQEFFATAMEKAWFHRYDASRGRFRAFLRGLLDDFARSAFRDARRLKRGGGLAALTLDDAAAALVAPDAIDRMFEREWARSVLTIATERLRSACATHGKEVAWLLYARYDLTDAPDDARPTYAALALEFGEPVTQVTNHLAWARRRMREEVLGTVRLLTGSEDEYRDEVRVLLGVEAP